MLVQIADSPFSKLKDLMVELTEEQKLPIPRAFMRMALSMMKRSVKKRANFNIDDVSPIDVVGQSFIPALFGTFVGPSDSLHKHSSHASSYARHLLTKQHAFCCVSLCTTIVR